MNRDDLPEIKQALKDRIQELCRALLPDGRPIGRLYIAHNPVTLDHDKSPEFKVALNRDTGAWKDWRTGEKGDVIRLIEYVKGTDFAGAMQFARDFLGIRQMTAEERRRFTEESRARVQAASVKAEKDQRRNREKGEALFLEGLLDGAGSTAEHYAKRYFEGRGCPLFEVPNRDLATMRYSAGTEYWKLADWKRHADGRLEKLKAGPKLPAIHSAFRTATGQVVACHCTFLDPVEPIKARLGGETAKLMRGEVQGAVIRISHGPEGLPPEEARRAFPLIIGEGIENSLSVAIAVPEARVWAAGSLANIGNCPVDLPCVSSVIVAIDNDWANAQAQKQLENGLRALAAKGKPLSTMAAHAGGDFNDLF